MADFDSNNTRSGVYISAQDSSIRGNHQTLLDPQFTFVFYVIRKKIFTEARTRVQTLSHTRHTFEHPISRLESEWNSIPIAAMLVNMRLPFLLQNPFWVLEDESQSASNPSRLRSHADVITKISEFTRRIIQESRGYHRVRMTVTIEKRVVVSDSQVLIEQPPSPSRNNLPSNNYSSSSVASTRTSLRRSMRRAIGGLFEPLLEEASEVLARLRSNRRIDMFVPVRNEVREAAMVELMNWATDDSLFEPIPDEAMETAEIRLNPAANSAVDALEKLRYDGSSNSNSKSASTLICPVCMEEVIIGSHLARMPCSHMFHQDCILEWLKRSHTCPVCRFKLPIRDV